MHLRRYLTTSPTSLRRTLDRVLLHVNAWGQQQFERLAPDMPRRDVLLAVDENFHWDKILLGSIDVVTGFVFGERMSDARDGRTWTAAVRLRHLRAGARRADGPRPFHLQHAVCKTTALPMASRARRDDDDAAKRRAGLAEVQAQRDAAAAAPRGVGRPPDWAARVARSLDALMRAEAHARAMRQEREVMRATVRSLGDAYHPVDLRTGERVSAEEVRERLQDAAVALCEQAARASLGERVIRALNGLFGQLDGLAAMVRWWHQEVSPSGGDADAAGGGARVGGSGAGAGEVRAAAPRAGARCDGAGVAGGAVERDASAGGGSDESVARVAGGSASSGAGAVGGVRAAAPGRGRLTKRRARQPALALTG